MDINVFAALRDPSRKADLDYLIEQKKYHVFLFSDAHLDDLHRDATDLKYADLEFMHHLVDGNYLVHATNEKRCNIFMATPTEAFRSRQFQDLSGIGDLLSGAGMDGLFGQLFSMLRELVLPLNLASNIAAMDEEQREFWLRLIPHPKDVYTLGEWLDLSSAFLRDLVKDKTYYRGIRGTFSDALHQVDFKDVNKDIQMNDGLGNQCSLRDLVRKGVEAANKNKTPALYEYVFSAFLMLNLFRLDEEKNKKAVFPNTHTDADHAFFGGHCDYVISNDAGFVVKANMVYGMFETSAVALTLDQLLIRLRYQDQTDERTASSLLKTILHDLAGALVTSEPGIRFPWRTYSSFHVTTTYLDYFNELQQISEKDMSVLTLSKTDRSWASFTMYAEHAVLVNRLVGLFGLDGSSRGLFTDTDIEELRLGEWKGRVWDIGHSRIALYVTHSTGRVHLGIAS
ncbi:MAG: hypothetical protein KA175_07040 [Flavobacteriales bacterium]|nr:hypothetical protein [Flavobacteriales bacterium]